MKESDIKERMLHNFLRLIQENKLIEERGWQRKLAGDLKTTEQHLNAILHGRSKIAVLL